MTGTLFIEASLLAQQSVKDFVAANPDKTLVILAPEDTKKSGLFSKKYSDQATQSTYKEFKKRKPIVSSFSDEDLGEELETALETSEKPLFFISSSQEKSLPRSNNQAL